MSPSRTTPSQAQGNMKVRLLGTVDLVKNGQPLHLGPQQRALLAALASHARTPITSERLVRLLWGEDASAASRVTLRSHVLRLRQHFATGGHEAAVARVGDGYALNLDDSVVDVRVFAEAVREAGDALSASDPAKASALLKEAFDLWSGNPLTGIEQRPWVVDEVRRLIEMQTLAGRLRADADLALGKNAEASLRLRDMLQATPEDVGLRLKLALALYRDGRQPEALGVCREGIRILSDLGLDGAQLQMLQKNILREAPDLNLVTSQTKQPIPRQVPPRSSQFTGRSGELLELRKLLSRSSSEDASTIVISAIAGTGGVGKTALAVQFANDVMPEFPDGQLYVNLHGYDTGQRLKPTQVLDRFLRALGVTDKSIPTDIDEQSALYRTLLADKKMLIVLDNAASAEQIRPLLPSGSRNLVLITSRDTLSGVVATEGANLLRLDVLAPDDAVSLLQTVTGHCWAGKELEAAQEVVQHCGYLPLAVRIAGSKMISRQSMTIYRLAELLRDERRRLRHLEAGDVAVRASFQLSYASLPLNTAQVFRRLGMIAGPDFTADAAACLMESDVDDVLDRLEELLGLNLVESTGEDDRFRFHDLVRLYARERADAEEPLVDRLRLVRRLLQWYIQTADRASGLIMRTQRMPRPLSDVEPVVPFESRSQALRWLEAERANLAAATRQAFKEGLNEETWSLADAQWGFFYLRKHWTDWIDTHQDGLAAARRASSEEAEAWMLVNLGVAYWDSHQFELSIDCSKKSAAISEVGGFLVCLGRAYNGVALACRQLGRYEEALENVNQALPIRRQAGDRWGEGVSLDNKGLILGKLRRYEESVEVFAYAMQLWEELRDPWGEALTLTDQGRVLDEAGHPQEAVENFRRALKVRREVGDRWGEGETLFFLGQALVHTNDFDGGRRSMQNALKIMTELKASEAAEIRAELGKTPAMATT